MSSKTQHFLVANTSAIKVVDVIKVDFISELLAGVLWHYVCDDIDKYNKAVAYLKYIGSFTNNPCKFDLDLNDW